MKKNSNLHFSHISFGSSYILGISANSNIFQEVSQRMFDFLDYVHSNLDSIEIHDLITNPCHTALSHTVSRFTIVKCEIKLICTAGIVFSGEARKLLFDIFKDILVNYEINYQKYHKIKHFTSQQHSFCLIYAYGQSLLSIFIALILFNKILNHQPKPRSVKFEFTDPGL